MSEIRQYDQEVTTLNDFDSLALLDLIPPASEEVLPTDVCIEVYKEIAHQEIETLLQDMDQDVAQDEYPASFVEMLDTANGNFLQRAAKAWIKPRNPEGTIKLMQQLQVDKFQAVPLWFVKKLIKILGLETPERSNYLLGKPNLNSMVDFATHQNTLNEIIHMYALGLNSLVLLPALATGKIDEGVIVNLGAFAINTYCVLSQRYSRARLTIAIDKALARKKDFDPDEYSNMLGLKLPPKTPSLED